MISQTTRSVNLSMQAELLPASNKHCVFRSDDHWYSVPAVSIREIVTAPSVMPVPECHEALAGLCHLRSDFVPVLSLRALLESGRPGSADPQDNLLVFSHRNPWALLISGSAGLESVETIVSQESSLPHTNNPVIGTAMSQDRVVRVLNPNTLLKKARLALESFWSGNSE